MTLITSSGIFQNMMIHCLDEYTWLFPRGKNILYLSCFSSCFIYNLYLIKIIICDILCIVLQKPPDGNLWSLWCINSIYSSIIIYRFTIIDRYLIIVHVLSFDDTTFLVSTLTWWLITNRTNKATYVLCFKFFYSTHCLDITYFLSEDFWASHERDAGHIIPSDALKYSLEACNIFAEL